MAIDADRALRLDDCPAAAIWRKMIGKNDKAGWCFPLPADCNESGERIRAIPQADRGPNVDRPFA